MFAFPQSILGALLRGNVAGHAKQSNEFTGRIPNRIFTVVDPAFVALFGQNLLDLVRYRNCLLYTSRCV